MRINKLILFILILCACGAYLMYGPKDNTKKIKEFLPFGKKTDENSCQENAEGEGSSLNQESKQEGTDEQPVNKINGILYTRSKAPSVMIDKKVYFTGDMICGGKIVDISRESIRVKFDNAERRYTIGNCIE